MNISEYIINEINKFLLAFTEAKVKYGHDEMARIHTVEVYPSSLFDLDVFQKWEGSMIEEFIKQNPTENICICPKDDILGIGDLLYEKEGIGFGDISQSKNPCPIISVFTTIKTEGAFPLSPFTLDDNVDRVSYPQKNVDDNYLLAA